MIEFDLFEGTGEVRRFLEQLDEFITKRGYPDALGVLIVPLMDDGFGVLGARRGPEPMTSEQAFEYLVACADHIRTL